MKKIMFLMFAVLMSINAMAADELLYVKSGNATVLKEAATSTFNVDYSNVKINDLTLDGYAQTRSDKDFLENYAKDMANGGKQFAKRFSGKSKTFKFDNKAAGKYTTTFNVESMDMGNFAVGFFSMKKGQGGIGLVGDITVKDASTGETVLVLRVDNVKGLIDFSESSRIQSAFDELARAVVKMVKKLD